jgi:tetratricopeptide (TPR) repeat protein
MADDRAAENRNEIGGGSQHGPVLQGRDFFGVSIQSVTPAPVALTQLPPRAAGFTGRDAELAMMRSLLDPAEATGPVLVWAVAGLAGVGKTTLAIQAGHSARECGWFGGGVLCIDLHGYDDKPVEPMQALDAMLRALGIPDEHIPPSVDSRTALYRSELAKISKPVLVIADNVSSETQVRPLLPSFGPHQVIITSRHTLGGLDARLMDVSVLSEADSRALLDKALRAARPTDNRISKNPEAAARLAECCGGLPLALQIVAAILKADPARHISGLADELTIVHKRLNHLKYDDGGGASAPSVKAAFELSYRRLSEEAAMVFRIIPLNPGPEISTAAVAALARLDVNRAGRVLAELSQAHLIETTPGIVDRWQMHDLVRLYAAGLADVYMDAEAREEARDRLFAYYVAISADAVRRVRTLGRAKEPSVFAGSGEALTWLDVERPNLAAVLRMAAATGRESVVLRLRSTLVEVSQPSSDDLLATLALFLATARDLGDRQGEGIALGNLGVLLQDVRRFEEAIDAFQSAAAIFRETSNLHGEGAALTNLGLALQGLRKFEEAVSAHQASAVIFQETGNKRGEGMALNSLGAALQEQKRFEEAIAAYRQSAAIFRNTSDPYREGMALDNLGLGLKCLGRLEEAIIAHKDAAALFERAGDRNEESRALRNLQEIKPSELDRRSPIPLTNVNTQ